LVKAIVDKLDMPTLKCDLVGCAIMNDDRKMSFGHCHNLIHIKDEKYGINGYYAEDACWDALTNEYQNGKGFAHCLYPIKDVDNFLKGRYYNKHASNRLNNILYSIESRKNKSANPVKWALDVKTREIIESLNIKQTPELIKRYGNDSNPISLEKYYAAIERVYLSMNDNLDEAKECCQKEIENSKRVANKYFKPGASNSFLESNGNRKR
jgi:hypothetical protein